MPPPLRSSGISSRETEVLELLVQVQSTSEIATKLFLSPRTVKSHSSSLLQGSGTSSRPELVTYATEHGVGPRRPSDAEEVIIDLSEPVDRAADQKTFT